MAVLRTHDRPLLAGTIVDRPNRFVVRARFDDTPERVYLGDPGALEGIIEPGYEIHCSPADDPDRATAYDAVAVRIDDTFVSVRAALANDLLHDALDRDAVPGLAGYAVRRREPTLPDHGRADFRLDTPSGGTAIAEAKSCTHVEARVAKFPDRQTERGRRHLRSLIDLADGDREAHLVFVVQRPDVDRVAPYRSVDPDFADLLARARDGGVGIHAIATAFEPPTYRLHAADLPVDTA